MSAREFDARTGSECCLPAVYRHSCQDHEDLIKQREAERSLLETTRAEGAALISLTDAELRALRNALRTPRGRYGAARASQLSGVPQRTLYDWAANAILVPDFADESPRSWSYRDLVYARLCAWLRSKHMPRPDVARRVTQYRDAMSQPGDATPTVLRSDGRVITTGAQTVDPDTGVAFFDTLASFADTFDLLQPVEHEAARSLWGPNLVHPSVHTSMSPWVQGGEPCIRDTRLPTVGLYALHVDRHLDPPAIARLYPGVSEVEIEDAIALEAKLHHTHVQAA